MQILETERLILRHFTTDDAAFILELLNQPGWKRFIGDRGVNTIDDARKFIETAYIPSYAKNGFGLYAMELKDGSGPAGMCGLIKRDTLDDVDLGFALLSRFEGKGLAQEAANATLTYARDVLGIPRVVAITTVDNEKSGRVLERAGMTFESVIKMPGDPDPLRLYAIDLSSVTRSSAT